MTKVWMEGINGPAMDEWIIALRSGEFAQTVGMLADSVGFCCLGVATDRFQEECSLTKTWQERGERFTYTTANGTTHRALMPRVVVEHLGIPSKFIDIVDDYDVNIYVRALPSEENYRALRSVSDPIGYNVIGVSVLNDSLSLSFDEIADRIEDTFKVDVEV